jgi:hypothetical protein
MPHVGHVHVGPIHSVVAGRTDHLPVHVPSGSYVLSADTVSGMGEGNTLAGFEHIKRMFGGLPYHAQSATPYASSVGPYGSDLPKASGGYASATGAPVPCALAGGEYVLEPHEVAYAGEGDMEAGHRALDGFLKKHRALTIKTLKGLPGPKQD